MICGNTQAEIDRDFDVKHADADDRAEYYKEINDDPDFNSDIPQLNAEQSQWQIDRREHIIEQLLDSKPVADRYGLKHWLPAWLDEQQWAKELRKGKGLPLLVLYKIGDLNEGQMKLIKREAGLLASIIVG